jgi:hypothetical protein
MNNLNVINTNHYIQDYCIVYPIENYEFGTVAGPELKEENEEWGLW